jgi:hypothetical protein
VATNGRAKKEGDFDAIHEAYATADGYAKTLDRIYNEFKVAAGGTTMLTFVGEDGQESCADCRKYKTNGIKPHGGYLTTPFRPIATLNVRDTDANTF